MKDHQEHVAEILTHLRDLQSLASNGNAQAIEGLLQTAVLSSAMLSAIAWRPDGDPGKNALATVATTTDVWPVLIPAMEDIRGQCIENQIPTAFPGETFYRTAQGVRKDGKRSRPRELHPNSQTGFAKGVLIALEKARQWSAVYQSPQEYIETEAGRRLAFLSDADARHFVEAEAADGWLHAWEAGRDLPPLTAANVAEYVAAGMIYAESRCNGVWWNYPSPAVIEAADKIAKTGDRKCNTPRTIIENWLKAGFAQLSRQA